MKTIRTIECSGDAYEMGRHQGSELKDSIMDIIKYYETSEEFSSATGNIISPFRLLGLIGSASTAAARLGASETARQWGKRVEGIAAGAGIDKALARGIQAMETMLAFPLGVSQCTTVGVTAKRSDGMGPVLLKNYDISEKLRPTTFMRRSRPMGKLESFEMIINVLAGSHLVMNEEGLCLSYNYGMVNFLPRPFGILPTYAVQYAAENFTETRQVIGWVSEQATTNGCIMTVVDAKSNLCVIEKAGGHTEVRYPEDGVTVATNHFLTRDMKHYNYDVSAVFGKRAPAALRGFSVQESNETRMKRALELTGLEENGKQSREKISAADLRALASDHDGKEQGDEKTICRHHDAMQTLASIIVIPKKRKILLCNGHPCSAPFEELEPWG
ncbi:MAG: C45 family peptidase [Pseudomonadota bacterium]